MQQYYPPCTCNINTAVFCVSLHYSCQVIRQLNYNRTSAFVLSLISAPSFSPTIIAVYENMKTTRSFCANWNWQKSQEAWILL